jgi:hypothetical protein
MTEPNQPLFAVLAQLLVAYTHDFDKELEREFGRTTTGERPPSLAMWANVLRFVGDEGVALREIPTLSGIAKPAVRSMVSCLQRHGWISIDADEVVRLTATGLTARKAWLRALETVEGRWAEAIGTETNGALRTALELYDGGLGKKLPHYPMPAAHRGALPAGD